MEFIEIAHSGNYTLGTANGSPCAWASEDGHSGFVLLEDATSWGECLEVRDELESLWESLCSGVVEIKPGWGVIGSEFDSDSDWGVYPSQAVAMAARRALESSDWDANVVSGLCK